MTCNVAFLYVACYLYIEIARAPEQIRAAPNNGVLCLDGTEIRP